MTGKTFLNSVSNSEIDILQQFLEILTEIGSRYCLIGGLAVNAYAEPVVSLDLDVVVTVSDVDKVCKAAESSGLKVDKFEHSINLSSPKSDLRIQLQTDPRYQAFISRCHERELLGYRLMVASITDVLQGKIWAYQDKSRRKSKRQKDLADIARMVEVDSVLQKQLPPEIREELEY